MSKFVIVKKGWGYKAGLGIDGKVYDSEDSARNAQESRKSTAKFEEIVPYKELKKKGVA
ncbi:MAG: hypothetical protein IBX57_00430 [Gammaproteobacteria bacterium]|nr:hypothetical protein [Gammaproteobacteria bacterium]